MLPNYSTAIGGKHKVRTFERGRRLYIEVGRVRQLINIDNINKTNT
jgi:hypothetical protein